MCIRDRLVLTPLSIGGASIAARRWGPVFGGWLISLPLTSGPVSLFLVLDRGSASPAPQPRRHWPGALRSATTASSTSAPRAATGGGAPWPPVSLAGPAGEPVRLAPVARGRARCASWPGAAWAAG